MEEGEFNTEEINIFDNEALLANGLESPAVELSSCEQPLLCGGQIVQNYEPKKVPSDYEEAKLQALSDEIEEQPVRLSDRETEKPALYSVEVSETGVEEVERKRSN